MSGYSNQRAERKKNDNQLKLRSKTMTSLNKLNEKDTLRQGSSELKLLCNEVNLNDLNIILVCYFFWLLFD